jgi:hypothetical protein
MLSRWESKKKKKKERKKEKHITGKRLFVKLGPATN